MKYISTQVIEAVPMTAEEYTEVKQGAFFYSGEDRNGYQITHEDGRTEWKLGTWFESVHEAIDMTFGVATEAMKRGLKVALPYWQPDVFISLKIPDEHSKMTAPYFYVTSRFGRVPWVATQIELLSTAWRIVQ